MGVRYPSSASVTIANVLPAGSADTVLCILPSLSPSLDAAQIMLQWFADITAGAATTSHRIHIRRGTTTAGSQVGAAAWQPAATGGVRALLSGCYLDVQGTVANQSYCLTVEQISAGAAGTLNDVCLLAFCL